MISYPYRRKRKEDEPDVYTTDLYVVDEVLVILLSVYRSYHLSFYLAVTLRLLKYLDYMSVLDEWRCEEHCTLFNWD